MIEHLDISLFLLNQLRIMLEYLGKLLYLLIMHSLLELNQ